MCYTWQNWGQIICGLKKQPGCETSCMQCPHFNRNKELRGCCLHCKLYGGKKIAGTKADFSIGETNLTKMGGCKLNPEEFTYKVCF